MLSLLQKPWAKALLIWFIVGILAVYIRLYPAWGHLWSPTREMATMGIVYKLKETFLAQIHAQFPQMSVEEASAIASAKLNETLRTEKANVARAIEKANESLFAQSKLPNNIYLLESDPYYFYNLTEDIVTSGKMANIVKGHQYFNTYMTAPFGFWQPLSLHPYVGFIVYKTSQLFNSSIKLMEAVAYTPVILTFFVVGAFIGCGRLFPLSWGTLGLASLYFAMLPVFLKRSALGWYDTDPYNLLFTLGYFAIFFKTCSTNAPRKLMLWGALMAANMILFSLIWQGWVFLFFMTIIASLTSAGFGRLFQHNRTIIREQSTFLLTFLGMTTLLGVIIYGFSGFFTFFTEGSSELGKFTHKGLNLWPNLFMEVGELKKSSLTDILADTGGPVFLCLSFLGSLLACFNIFKNRSRKEHLKTITALVFLLITTVLTLKATRFVLFMLIPLAFFFALSLETLAAWFKRIPYSKIITITCALCLTVWCWVEANSSIRSVLTPIFNDVWNENLSALRQKTETDAIINTWWPPGHFIKAIAHRRVMFDGASLGESQTGYWIAKTLLSTDEREARGILRMLNLSGNKAADFLTTKGIKTSDAVDILTAIAPLSREKAKQALSPLLKNNDTDTLLELTHGRMPHSYLLIYNEIIDQNIGIVFVGRRNFRKIEETNANPQLLAQAPKPDSKEFINYLWDLAGGESKYSEAFSVVKTTDDGLLFAPGLLVSKDLKNAVMNSDKYGHGSPQSIVYLKDGKIIEHKIPGATLGYSIVLYEQDHQSLCRLMDTSLANSLMMKLYFFNGQGLEHFKLIQSNSDLTGRTQIKTFQVL